LSKKLNFTNGNVAYKRTKLWYFAALWTLLLLLLYFLCSISVQRFSCFFFNSYKAFRTPEFVCVHVSCNMHISIIYCLKIIRKSKHWYYIFGRNHFGYQKLNFMDKSRGPNKILLRCTKLIPWNLLKPVSFELLNYIV